VTATVTVGPDELGDEIGRAALRPLLVGLDIDGVLSPIVEHAHESALLPGMLDDIVALCSVTPVAVVSGRDLAAIERLFGFPEDLTVVGSHGLEPRGTVVEPSAEERARLGELVALAERAGERVGEGAWVEHKPLSVALHTRQAVAPGRSVEGAAWLGHAAEQVAGTTIKFGSEVVELLARPTSKATAVAELRRAARAASVLFVGDDVTDEDVFAVLGDDDWSVRVGPGETSARHRLADPAAVHQFVRRLAHQLTNRLA